MVSTRPAEQNLTLNPPFLYKKINKEDKARTGCRPPCSPKLCCKVTLSLGSLLLLVGTVVLITGQGVLKEAILNTLALHPASDTLHKWLRPPVEPTFVVHAFHVTNPVAVILGQKPKLQEIGPFTYQAVTVKDSVDQHTGKENLEYNDDGETLTYRQRNIFFFDPSQSIGDPDTTFITVPNIPLFTGMAKIRELGWGKGTAANLIQTTGLGTPFINVSISGLLWGYNDELPCLTLSRPEECGVSEGEVDLFAEEDEEEDGWDDWKRKKRAAGRYKRQTIQYKDNNLKNADFESMEKPKQADYVGCNCEWGLFREWNVTLKPPLKIHHGMADRSKKGWVDEFDSSPFMNWWQPESACDRLGGQDAATLPPNVTRFDHFQMFIFLMCRKINLVYEKDVQHMGLNSYRFIPPVNDLGSHTDPDPFIRNPDNSCYCLEEEGMTCLKSGVLNMAPCKRTPDLPKGAPIAISWPHFYQADPSFFSAVSGLSPDKEKHQFYVDIAPEFGFPLAIRPRFQLSVIIRRDTDIPIMSKFPDQLVLPFLWAEDGFSEPTTEMADLIEFGLAAPKMLSELGGTFFIVIGGVMVLISLAWVWWTRNKLTEVANI